MARTVSSRQEYWSGLPFPPPGELLDLGIKPVFLTSPALAGRFFTTSFLGSLRSAWKVKVKVAQSCLTLCDLMDVTLHGILQARIQEWVDLCFSRVLSQPRNWTQVSRIAGRFFTSWATSGAQEMYIYIHIFMYVYKKKCIVTSKTSLSVFDFRFRLFHDCLNGVSVLSKVNLMLEPKRLSGHYHTQKAGDGFNALLGSNYQRPYWAPAKWFIAFVGQKCGRWRKAKAGLLMKRATVFLKICSEISLVSTVTGQEVNLSFPPLGAGVFALSQCNESPRGDYYHILITSSSCWLLEV